MCLECEKKTFVKCIKSVDMDQSEVFTEGKIYGAFSWYFENDDCYILTAMDNKDNEHNISDANEDNILEFSKYQWFIEHFEVVAQ